MSLRAVVIAINCCCCCYCVVVVVIVTRLWFEGASHADGC